MEVLYNRGLQVFWTLCGSDGNNAYLVVCPQTQESVIIDAPLEPVGIIRQAKDTTVKAILITHHHQDHVEGLKDIISATRAPVITHSKDAPNMTIPPDIVVEDGDSIWAGRLDVKAIHSPGHSPGSVCYMVCNHLFTGDTLCCHGPGESWGVDATQQILNSIAGKLLLLPDDTFLLPGHGNGITLGISKQLYQGFVLEYPEYFPKIPIPDSLLPPG